MTLKWEARLTTVAAVCLGIIGAGLILVAAQTPWHSDSDAYFRDLNAIRAELYPQLRGFEQGVADPHTTSTPITFREASRRFGEIQDQYATHKWLYADLGYVAIAWSLVLAIWSVVRSERFLADQPQTRMIVAITIASILAAASLAAGIFQPLGREQIPEWSDSVGLVVGAIPIFGIIAAVVLAIVATPVWALDRVPPRQLIWPKPYWKTVIYSVLFAGPVVLGAMLVGLFWQVGGWAMSPMGFLVMWIALESRAAVLTK